MPPALRAWLRPPLGEQTADLCGALLYLETSWLRLRLGLPLKRPPRLRAWLPAEAGVDEDVAGAAEPPGADAQDGAPSVGLGAGRLSSGASAGARGEPEPGWGAGTRALGRDEGPLATGGGQAWVLVGATGRSWWESELAACLSRVGAARGGTAQPSWEEAAVPAAGQLRSAAPSPCSTALDLLLQPRTRENPPGFSCLQGHEE